MKDTPHTTAREAMPKDPWTMPSKIARQSGPKTDSKRLFSSCEGKLRMQSDMAPMKTRGREISRPRWIAWRWMFFPRRPKPLTMAEDNFSRSSSPAEDFIFPVGPQVLFG